MFYLNKDSNSQQYLTNTFISMTFFPLSILLLSIFCPTKPRPAFCGAYIHDLGRSNDFVDRNHGAESVARHFDKFEHLWKIYGLTPQEQDYIKKAVIQHSTKEWTNPGDDGYDVMAILKDADALDRCRLGDLDPSYLRYSESIELICVIRSIFVATWDINEDKTLPEFMKVLQSGRR